MTEFGLKATQQRFVIYRELASRKDHPTAEKIHDSIRSANPSLSLGTIYKTLDTFVEVKLACKVLSDKGVYRYDANIDSHNHIYCENTEEILDYKDNELNDLIQKFFSEKNIDNLNIKEIRLQIIADKINPDKEAKIN